MPKASASRPPADDDALGWSVGVGFAISNDSNWFARALTSGNSA
ncbi:MAG: hypothetical protein R3E54_17805 [Halioglobus sp.]